MIFKAFLRYHLGKESEICRFGEKIERRPG